MMTLNLTSFYLGIAFGALGLYAVQNIISELAGKIRHQKVMKEYRKDLREWKEAQEEVNN